MSRDDSPKLPKDAPVGQLPPLPWMQASETRKVLAALAAEGTEVRFAGGCVRDSLLRRPVRDIDIATPDKPERVMELLKRAGITAIPTGFAHGTVTAVIGRAHFEITTLRVDVETDGRHARVAFVDDWAADAARRDFTINALYARPDGAVIDPCDGLPDIGAGRVRFVGNPMARIEEDALRILRFFRFQAHYGQVAPDSEALAACQARASLLESLSGERIRDEMLRLLQAPDPVTVLLLMEGQHVLQHILPEAHEFGRLRQLTFLETRGILRTGIAPDPLRRLAALLRPEADSAERVAARWRLSNAQSQSLVELAAPARKTHDQMEPRDARQLLQDVGPDQFRDLVLLGWSAHRASEPHRVKGENQRWLALLDEADSWRHRTLPVQGSDVLALGVTEGPRVGLLLAEIERWWRGEDFTGSREQALARLHKLIDDGFGLREQE